MNQKVIDAVDNFKLNVDYVYRLMNFDRNVLDFSIKTLESLADKLKNQHKIDNPYISVDNSLTALKQVRQNGSMRQQYDTIFNQCIVLLVSYFSSALSDIFKFSLNERVKSGVNGQLAKEEIKISLAELSEFEFNISDNIGDIIANKKEISFQDMQSVARAFRDYLEIEIEKDKIVNNLIVGQACRHIIVHAGDVVNSKLIKQLSFASPRDIMLDISIGEHIRFTPEEIKIVGESMITYTENVINKIEVRSELNT